MQLHALPSRLSRLDILQLCARLEVEENLRTALLHQLFQTEGRNAMNVAWIATHLEAVALAHVAQHVEKLAQLAMQAPDATMLRLRLTLVLHILEAHPPQQLSETLFRLLDFALQHIAAASCGVASLSLCIKLAERLTRCVPELRTELQAQLELLDDDACTPAVRSVKRHTLQRLMAAPHSKRLRPCLRRADT